MQYSENNFMVCCTKKAMVYDFDTMDLLKVININLVVDEDLNRQQLCVSLLSERMIPETGQQFMLEFYDSQFVTIRNIQTGSR